MPFGVCGNVLFGGLGLWNTHLEGLHDHSHGDATSKVVEMPGHGIGRLRRALEAQGIDVQTILPATQPEIPGHCTVAIDANPRTTYLPGESSALEAYLARGGALLLLYDLGFVIEPRLAGLLATLGILLPQQVVILRLTREEQVADPITTLKVRGAPAIGVTAAFGIVLSLYRLLREQGDGLLLLHPELP